MHDERLLGLVDGWLTGMPADAFTEVLPLLRRTFAAFAAPERRDDRRAGAARTGGAGRGRRTTGTG